MKVEQTVRHGDNLYDVSFDLPEDKALQVVYALRGICGELDGLSVCEWDRLWREHREKAGDYAQIMDAWLNGEQDFVSAVRSLGGEARPVVFERGGPITRAVRFIRRVWRALTLAWLLVFDSRARR